MIKKRKNQKGELERLRKEVLLLRKMVSKDPLTGLYNRRGFLDEVSRLEKIVNNVGQRKPLASGDIFEKFGLIFLDLDNFKQVNDKFGHKAGDLLLQKIGGVLSDSLRKFDIVCRWGGDEFVILILGVGKEGIFNIASRLKAKIEEIISILKNKKIKITASFGIVSFSSKDFNIEKYIEKVDKAMYFAKKKGKNEIFII